MRLEFGDQVPVHLNQRLFGLLVLIQHQFGGDGTGHLGCFLHHDHLESKGRREDGEGKIDCECDIVRCPVVGH